MAVDPKDVGKTPDMFSDAEKQWIYTALIALEKSVLRSRNRYPSNSASYRAHDEDVSRIRMLIERLK